MCCFWVTLSIWVTLPWSCASEALFRVDVLGRLLAFAYEVHLGVCAFLGLCQLVYLLARKVVPDRDGVTSRLIGPNTEHECISQRFFFCSLSVAAVVNERSGSIDEFFQRRLALFQAPQLEPCRYLIAWWLHVCLQPLPHRFEFQLVFVLVPACRVVDFEALIVYPQQEHSYLVIF